MHPRWSHVAALSILCLAASPTFAHRLHVSSPTPVGPNLRVEAYYDDNTPAQEARIAVKSGETIVVEGKTDERGVWTFPLPAPGNYTVTAESTGHTAKEQFFVGVGEASQVADAEEVAREREEKTRTPWLGLGVGWAAIGALSGLWLYVRRKLRKREAKKNRAGRTDADTGKLLGEGEGEGEGDFR